MMPAQPLGDAKRAELVVLSTLHRVSVAPKPVEADLDRRIAERPTVSPKHRHLVETPKGIVIGRAYTPPPAPMFGEARRVQKLVLRAAATDGEYRDPSPWVREAEISAAEDEHSQAMAATGSTGEPWAAIWAHRIVGVLLLAMLAAVACDYLGWSQLLSGNRP